MFLENQTNGFRFAGENGFFPSVQNSSQLYLARWLDDTPIYYDALEIISEKARRFWWGQQVDLATTSWGLLLAIEGRRRRIPLLPAFLALAHVVNLSFAQNLFYLALLFTPSPIAAGNDVPEFPIAPVPVPGWARIWKRLLPAPKPRNWHPHPALFLGTTLVNLVAIYVLPYAAERPSFTMVVLIARASTFLPLILPRVVPVSWGRRASSQPVATRGLFPITTTTLFQVLSVASFALYAKATILALMYNTPDAHHHRHSRLWPWGVEERSVWESSTTALGKVLGSTADHPVVAGVGGDALLCALSLGLWATVRAVNAREILECAVPFYTRSGNGTGALTSSSPASPAKSEASVLKGEDQEDEPAERYEQETTEFATPPVTPRQSEKSKMNIMSVASSSGGSIISEETPTRRRRGQPRRKVPVEDSADVEEEEEVDEPEDDKSYDPAVDGAYDTVKGDALPSTELDWEKAALAWGLTIAGGLGSACAAVFGAECGSRQ